MTKDFLKDMFKYLPAQVVPGIMGIISISVITRLFTPADYGNYSLVMATVVVLTTLSGWLPMSIIRFYPSHERDKNLNVFYTNIFSLTVISVLIITVSFFLGLFAIKAHLSSALYSLMYVGIGIFIVTSVFDVLRNFLRAKRQVGWYSAFTLWRSIGSLGIGLLLIFLLKRSIEFLLWGGITCVVIVLPLLWQKANKKDVSALHFKIDSFSTKEMARYGFPLVVANLAAWILSLSDRYILAVFRGAKEVGIYSASYNIAQHSVMLVASLFMLTSMPILVDIWEKEGKSRSGEFLNKVTRYYLIVCVPAVVGLSALSKPIMEIMTGNRYTEGHEIIPFVSLGAFFLGLQKRFNDGLLLAKKTDLITYAIILSGLLNLCLNFLFIPRYGYLAAAITTLIAYVFLLFFMIILCRRFFVWEFPFKSLRNAVFASTIMGIIIYPICNSFMPASPTNLILGICLGWAVYYTILFVLQELRQKEIQQLRRIKEKILGEY